MRKQPSRGHISVKGEVYKAFRAECHTRNLSMGRVMDDLIRAHLDLLEDFYVPVREPASPEQILATFHHRFGMPGPVASILPNEIEPTPQGKPGSIFVLDPDPYHVEVTRKEKVYADAVAESIIAETQAGGLFSPEGIKEAEENPAPVVKPRAAKGTKPVPNADDLPSCIDTTFGKK